MRIESIRLHDFRNLKSVCLKLRSGANLIYGDNGQGKTNLIEAMWLFTGAKSFRGAKDAQMIRFGAQQACMELAFFAQERSQQSLFNLGRGRGVFLNDVPLKSASELAGHFCAVVFSPAHLALVQSGPKEKRRFIDTAICQMKPRYIYYMSQYQRILDQRNRLLKDGTRQQIRATLDIWDDRLAAFGALIMKTRETFLQRLLPYARARYAGISGGREVMDFCYAATLKCDLAADVKEIEAQILESLRENREEDERLRVTNKGPHRDDLCITLSDVDARSYGSQGQQRSCVLAVKLAECELCREVTGEYPVMLFDDVLSELDSVRRAYLLHHLDGMQSVITCCNRDDAGWMPEGAAVRIQNGSIVGG